MNTVFAIAVLLAISPTCVRPGTSPLPTATATLHWGTVDLPRGSYCWNFGEGGECADSAGPDQLLKTGYLKPYRTAGGFDATVHFHATSGRRSLTVSLLLTPGEISRGHVSQPTQQTFRIPEVASSSAGVYVYAVTGTWAEGDVSFLLALDLIPGVA